jgi:hypothetical protein
MERSAGKVTKINSPTYSKRGASLSLFQITSEGKNVWVTLQCEKIVNAIIKACGTVQKTSP